MRFKEVYGNWQKDRLTQAEAALILGVTDRTFRRYIDRYEESGLEGLADKRLTQTSHRRAPVDEVIALVDLYSTRHQGWNAQHFHDWYSKNGGSRSYRVSLGTPVSFAISVTLILFGGSILASKLDLNSSE